MMNSPRPPGFTLIELLVVIAVIGILASLVLGTVGYVQKKSARSRAEAEIAALSTAIEAYKVEYGTYPVSSSAGVEGSRILHQSLVSSDAAHNPHGKIFIQPALTMLEDTGGQSSTYFVDPYGNAYNYTHPGDSQRSGEDFYDLWSEAGANPSNDENQWIKNW